MINLSQYLTDGCGNVSVYRTISDTRDEPYLKMSFPSNHHDRRGAPVPADPNDAGPATSTRAFQGRAVGFRGPPDVVRAQGALAHTDEQ